jgi:hypothetical protein
VNIFFGDSGDDKFTSKILASSQYNSLLYWLYNIIKQNMPHPSFPRLLVNLRHSLKNFLYKQWHEMLRDDQLDELYRRIVGYFGLEERIRELGGENVGENRPRNPPELRIRGLLMRPKEEATSDAED